MTRSITGDARAVFLPAFADLTFQAVAEPFLQNGGCAVLLGETRSEYLARRMSPERRGTETAASVRRCIDRLRCLAPDLIVAVDEEPGGICRLEGLVPPLPSPEEASAMDEAELAARCFETAAAARALGVTMFLAPVADVVGGRNPWLAGRTMGREAGAVARLVRGYVRGIQRAGLVAVTKHFPGYGDIAADPALVDVCVETPLAAILAQAAPFRAAIEAGTRAVMTGPAPLAALDAVNAASTSPAVMRLLRQDFGFRGLIVSDDLDAPATMRGRSLQETAVAALAAGADLLLVAGGPHLDALCDHVAAAAGDGRLPAGRLEEAAGRVRALAAGR